jgi:hypothetical protein
MARYPIKQFSDKEKRQILAMRRIGVAFKTIATRMKVSETFVRKNYAKWMEGQNERI